MSDLNDVLSKHLEAQRGLELSARSAVRDAEAFMKGYTGTPEEKLEKWSFFEDGIAKMVTTLVRFKKMEVILRGKQAEFAQLGNDFGVFEASLRKQSSSIQVTSADVSQHSLMLAIRRHKQDALDSAEVQIDEDSSEGMRCPVSQQCLDELPRTRVYGSSSCIHRYSEQIFDIFSSRAANARHKCPVPGCNKTLIQGQLKPLAV
eukprot:INCI16076.1.p1 GENE.INCI16076.1~~INCI16076.1.p1  ORF type:complete len:204 (-),score=47.43 INCI16076.1:466-1077(-)